MKVVILAGGLGTRLSRGDAGQAQADGRDRRAPDPLAHHEDLRRARVQRVRDLPRLQGLHRSRSTSPTTSCTTRDVTFDLQGQWHGGPRERRRAVAGDARRHGRRRRRPAGASSGSRRYVGDERFMLTYGDGVADVDIQRAARVPRGARQARDRHRGAAAGPLRRARARRRRGHGALLRGEAAAATAPGSTAASSCWSPACSTTSRATTRSWSGSPLERLAADGAARRLPPPRLLAADGHAARQAHARGAVGRPGAAPWKTW